MRGWLLVLGLAGCGHHDSNTACGWWSNDPTCGAQAATAPAPAPAATASTSPVPAPAPEPVKSAAGTKPASKHGHGHAAATGGGRSITPPDPECRADSDCPRGKVCDHFTCEVHTLTANGLPCEYSDECASGDCIRGMCEGSKVDKQLGNGASCERDSDCISHDCHEGRCRGENSDEN